MTSHTPGPWSAGGPQWSRSRRTPETQKRAITAPNHPVIANAYGEANARLIAAAPEQHAALLPIAMFPLEDFAQYDDCADMRVIFKANDWSLTVGDIRRARAAIAKATGATP